MQVAQVERRGAAAVPGCVFRGERRFAGDQREIREVAGSRFSDPERPLAGRRAGVRRLRTERAAQAMDVLHRQGRAYRGHREKGHGRIPRSPGGWDARKSPIWNL